MDSFKVKYQEEALELIGEMEKSLLQMEKSPDDSTLIEQVFRAMHNLKGNSSMFGLKTIAEFTHHLESIYDLIRAGQMNISRQIVDITFSALDHLALLVKSVGPLNEKEQKTHDQLSTEIIDLIHSTNSISNPKVHRQYHTLFKPSSDILSKGIDPLLLVDAVCELDHDKIIVRTDEIPCLEECDAVTCYTSWDIYTREEQTEAIRDIFSIAEDRCILQIAPASDNDAISDSKPAESQNKTTTISSIRVPSERLDNLMGLVSELMTMQAKLANLAKQNHSADLLGITENLEKISTRLRDNAFSMCLVPVELMVTPFHRLVRDLAMELNKEIQFVTEGTETELDKNIMEGLSDPLMHLIRNSIDHGIESPEERINKGKPKCGTIILKAFCAGSNVYIEIIDDGKGIDPHKIRNKAIQKGLLKEEDVLTDRQLLNLIFLPGFSTAEKVSDTSGRGVGMDVVKRKITDLRGQIKINSTILTGTTMTIRLPITVSIIDGLLVKVNGEDMVIPLSMVERCYELKADRELNRYTNLITLDDEQIPFIDLSENFFGMVNSRSTREIVIVYYDEKRVGLIVDHIVGKFQAVLKPLGPYFANMSNISGATILGDGNIALVLDTNNVIEYFLNKNLSKHVRFTANAILSDV